MTHLILYTDGSTRNTKDQNTYYGGWGIHGYLCQLNPKAKPMNINKEWVISSIGYMHKKSGPTEPYEDRIKMIHYIEQLGTSRCNEYNQQPLDSSYTEYLAIYKALLIAKEFAESITHLYIYSDHQSAINGFSGSYALPDWINDLYVTLKDHLSQYPIKLSFQWIKGHQRHWGNERAHHLAYKASFACRNGYDINDHWTTYIKKDQFYSPKPLSRLIQQAHWYFHTHSPIPKIYPTKIENCRIDPNGEYLYHLGHKNKKDYFVGKTHPKSMYSIVSLKECSKVLESLRSLQRAYVTTGNEKALTIGKIMNINKPEVLSHIERWGGAMLYKHPYHDDIYHYDELQLTEQLHPIGSGFTITDEFDYLWSYYQRAFLEPLGQCISRHDLTSYFYEKTNKGILKLHSHLGTDVKSISITFIHYEKKYTLELTFNIDLPSRNTLAAINTLSPNIHLYTWYESPKALRYFISIETDEGRGVWANPHANLIFKEDD